MLASKKAKGRLSFGSRPLFPVTAGQRECTDGGEQGCNCKALEKAWPDVLSVNDVEEKTNQSEAEEEPSKQPQSFQSYHLLS